MSAPDCSISDPRRLHYLNTCLRALMWVGCIYTPAFFWFEMYFASAAAALAAAATIWVRRNLDDPRMAERGGDIATAAVYVAVLGGCIEAGGMMSVLNPWWFVVPTMAALLGVRGSAKFWVLITITTLTSLVTMYKLGELPCACHPSSTSRCRA